jgi:pantoate--beta-alanine ligase
LTLALSRMNVIDSIAGMRSACAQARAAGKKLGFVPTMGALHEGHLSLVRAARERCDVVAASIFVNPTQFAPNEDFAKYPRTLERDSELLQHEHVDLLFTPTKEEMYPPGAVTFVEVRDLSDRLCGKSRPGHFRGVATIVNKLFNIVQPDFAFFGQKDAAQAAIIRRMVRDLDLAVNVVVCSIVREADGLAMSSRNAYLSATDREQAAVLSRALRKAESLYRGGERDPKKLIDSARRIFAEQPEVAVEYIEIVDPGTLETVRDLSHPALVAVAARVGSTRLIDNIVLP